MAKVKKRSAGPVYLVGAVWLVFGLCLPLYKPVHYGLAAAASLAAYWVGKAIWPDRILIEEDPAPKPEPPKSTGNPALDELRTEGDRAVSEMRRLNDAIEDPVLSAQIDRLEAATQAIVAQVIKEPDKLPQIRKFMNYYLPTTLKILNSYDRMRDVGVAGENIDNTIERIETVMENIVRAFEKQLDALFGAEALDISTDITVLENLLAREGLGGMQINDQT